MPICGLTCELPLIHLLPPTVMIQNALIGCAHCLEPIQEVEIHGQTFDLVKRRSMMRIMARRMKATTVVA